MSRQWLFKTEPSEYSYDDLERETKAVWDGVTNSLALKHLRQVRMGDEILIYHSGDVKAIIGLAQAVSDPYQNPREDDEKLIVRRALFGTQLEPHKYELIRIYGGHYIQRIK